MREYSESAGNASADYINQTAAKSFFELHELQKDPEPDLEERYLQLEYFHEDDPWQYLSKLGKVFLA